MTLAFQGKSTRPRASLGLIAVTSAAGAILAAFGLAGSQDASAAISGAIYTTLPDGQTVNANIYANKADVYLNGGPQNQACNGGDLSDGLYYFQVTSPDGVVLSSDPVQNRVVEAVGGVFAGNGGTGNHLEAVAPSPCGSVGVQLLPYDDTPNPGGEYSVNIYEAACVDAATTPAERAQTDPRIDLATLGCSTKNDNFKVGEQPTNTPTNTATATATATGTLTPTNTPTNTATNTPTNTPTATPTGTLTPTNTPTATPTGTLTPTTTPVNTATNTPTPPLTQVTQPAQPTSTATPTPEETVAGARTTPTPIPPASGTGTDMSAAGSTNLILFAIAGLLALTAGAATMGLAFNPRRDD